MTVEDRGPGGAGQPVRGVLPVAGDPAAHAGPRICPDHHPSPRSSVRPATSARPTTLRRSLGLLATAPCHCTRERPEASPVNSVARSFPPPRSSCRRRTPAGSCADTRRPTGRPGRGRPRRGVPRRPGLRLHHRPDLLRQQQPIHVASTVPASAGAGAVAYPARKPRRLGMIGSAAEQQVALVVDLLKYVEEFCAGSRRATVDLARRGGRAIGG